MNNLLSIGKFATFCNTTKDTLIHYDNLGLLKPFSFTPGNHRFYDIQQYHNFRLIQNLADIGIPLQEIKHIMQAETLSERTGLLLEKELELELRLQYLRNTRLFLEESNKVLPFTYPETSDTPFIHKLEYTQKLYATPFPCLQPTMYHFSQILKSHISQCNRNGIHPFPLGILIQRRDRGLSRNRHVFITSPLGNRPPDNQTIIKPDGKYASLFHTGSLQTVQPSVDLLYEYFYQNHYQIGSDTYITLYENGSPQKWEPIHKIDILIYET